MSYRGWSRRARGRTFTQRRDTAIIAVFKATGIRLSELAVVDAVETRPGTDPDRASFTTAMEAAKDQLTAARGACPDGPADLPGAIGRAVLATLLPARRPRYSARKVKCATSRYLNRDDGRPAHPTTITAIDIAVCTPPVDLKHGRTHRDRRSTPRPPQPPTRRKLITAIIASQPPRAWSGRELALRLNVKPRTLPTQLGEWAGFHHPHRIRHLRVGTQHADSRYTLYNHARPLTSRPCYAGRAFGAPLTLETSADPAGLTARARPEARPY